MPSPQPPYRSLPPSAHRMSGGHYDYPPASGSDANPPPPTQSRFESLRRNLEEERHGLSNLRAMLASTRDAVLSTASSMTSSSRRARRPAPATTNSLHPPHPPQPAHSLQNSDLYPRPSRRPSSPGRRYSVSRPSRALRRSRAEFQDDSIFDWDDELPAGSSHSRAQFREHMETMRSLLGGRLAPFDESLQHLSALSDLFADYFNESDVDLMQAPNQPNTAHRHRPKRRKLHHESDNPGFHDFKYGIKGQVNPGHLRMEIIHCDGGEYIHDKEQIHGVDNVLHNDSSVYCTNTSSCVMLLRHPGESIFHVEKIIIKAPISGFTAPIQQGLVFIGMQSEKLLRGASAYHIRYQTESLNHYGEEGASTIHHLLHHQPRHSRHHSESLSPLARDLLRHDRRIDRRLAAWVNSSQPGSTSTPTNNAYRDPDDCEEPTPGETMITRAPTPPPPFTITTDNPDPLADTSDDDASAFPAPYVSQSQSTFARSYSRRSSTSSSSDDAHPTREAGLHPAAGPPPLSAMIPPPPPPPFMNPPAGDHPGPILAPIDSWPGSPQRSLARFEESVWNRVIAHQALGATGLGLLGSEDDDFEGTEPDPELDGEGIDADPDVEQSEGDGHEAGEVAYNDDDGDDNDDIEREADDLAGDTVEEESVADDLVSARQTAGVPVRGARAAGAMGHRRFMARRMGPLARPYLPAPPPPPPAGYLGGGQRRAGGGQRRGEGGSGSGSQRPMTRNAPGRIERSSAGGNISESASGGASGPAVGSGPEGKEVVFPHAKFFICRGKSRITIGFDPPISGRFVLLKLFSPLLSDGKNIDIQYVAVHGFAGPRSFPAIEMM